MESFPKKQPESFVAEPGHTHIRLVEAGGQQQRIMGALLEMDFNGFGRDCDRGRGLDKVAEDMA